jgi:hypothetical protein
MHSVKYIFFYLGLLFPLSLFAQKNEEIAQQIVEELFSVIEEEDFDSDDYYIDLVHRLENPLPLNNAGRDELISLRFLSLPEVEAILRYRKLFGDFISIFELQAVEGLRDENLKRLVYFVHVDEDHILKKLQAKNFYRTGKHEVFKKYKRILEQEAGFSPDNRKYAGSPDQLYLRYTYRYGSRISYGFTAEKDPGEEFFKGSQPYGFDYFSAHFFATDIGRIKKISAGDYQLQFGQGLVMWSGLAFGKGADVINIAKNARGILPYRSTDENRFFRGFAATYSVLPKLDASVFASLKMIDAGIFPADTMDDADFYISSFQLSGLHRTAGEIEKRKNLQEDVFGGDLTYRFSRVSVGVTTVFQKYSHPIAPSGSLYKIHNFSGNSINNTGFNFNYFTGNTFFFSEIAINSQRATAGIGGVLMSLHKNVDIGLLFRSYSPAYHANFSNAFRESGSVNNENGIYQSLSLRLPGRFTFKAYADHFSFPWLQYLVDAPSNGYDYLADLNYRRSKNFEMYWRYRQRSKEKNSSEIVSQTKTPVKTLQQNFRYHVNYQLSHEITLKSRMEWSSFSSGLSEPQKGFLMYQDIKWCPKRKPYSFSGRYAVFDVENYYARIYTFESDVLYAFSVPFFQDEGVRYYLMAKYRVNRKTDFWLRLARTTLTDKEFFGSGNSRIDSNKKTEIKGQIRFRI